MIQILRNILPYTTQTPQARLIMHRKVRLTQSRIALAGMSRPRLPAAIGRGARRPAPDRVRIIVDEQDPPASGSRPRALDVRPLERVPASVAGRQSGKLRFVPTRVAIHTGEDVVPACAGVVTSPVSSSQAAAASFAED